MSSDEIEDIAGNGYSGFQDGFAFYSMFFVPSAIAVNWNYPYGDVLYITDSYNNCIRSINTSISFVETFAGNCSASGGYADGPLLNSSFLVPSSAKLLSTNINNLIVADTGNNKIRVIHIDKGLNRKRREKKQTNKIQSKSKQTKAKQNKPKQ